MAHRALVTLSMKGGVGKTTIAIGLTRALLRRGLKTGLLDIDIHGSAVPQALRMQRAPGYTAIAGAKLRPASCDGFQLFSIGLLADPDTANMWKGQMEAQAVEQVATFAIDWDKDMEWLVVDTPPTSGDEVQSLLEHMEGIYGCVIVTQPNDLSLLGITKTLNMLRDKGIRVCGLLTNMAGYRCPHCGEVSNPFDREPVDTEKVAEAFGVPCLGHVPFAGDEERAPVMDQVIEQILGTKPRKLRKAGPGIRRRVLGLILR